MYLVKKKKCRERMVVKRIRLLGILIVVVLLLVCFVDCFWFAKDRLSNMENDIYLNWMNASRILWRRAAYTTV